jgi:hypothetical protein
MASRSGRLSWRPRRPAAPTLEIPLSIRMEAAIAAQELADMQIDDMLGKPSHFTCPECHGALWEIEDGSLLRYRCHVGHAYTADAVMRHRAMRSTFCSTHYCGRIRNGPDLPAGWQSTRAHFVKPGRTDRTESNYTPGTRGHDHDAASAWPEATPSV